MFEALNKLPDLIQKMIDLNWKIHKSETDVRIIELIEQYHSQTKKEKK